MNNQKIGYCKKCHEKRRDPISFENITKIIEGDLELEIDSKCHNYCGPGKKQKFAFYDNEIYESNNIKEIIDQIRGDID